MLPYPVNTKRKKKEFINWKYVIEITLELAVYDQIIQL